jgi:3-phenylpropionate/trans-cinnamate dioxygenase ferredoxin reductase subunit
MEAAERRRFPVSDSRTFAVVGAGLAGAKAVEALRTEGFDGRVVLLGAEPHRPYERPPLSKGHLLGSSDRSAVYVHPAEWYEKHQVELRLDVPVVGIDRRDHELTTGDGDRLRYDRLLLATGATPRRLTVPGSDLDGVRYLRSLDDCDRLRPELRPDARVAIIGGGWIGLETAAAARARRGRHRARARRAAAVAGSRLPDGEGLRGPAHRARRHPAVRGHGFGDPACSH